MPIIDLHSGYWWDNEEPINENDNGLKLKMSFYTQLKIRKSNTKFDCHICRKSRGKGFRYIGTQWDKICFHCLDGWLKNSEKTIKEMQVRINIMKSSLKKDKKQWDRDAMIGALMTQPEEVK